VTCQGTSCDSLVHSLVARSVVSVSSFLFSFCFLPYSSILRFDLAAPAPDPTLADTQHTLWCLKVISLSCLFFLVYFSTSHSSSYEIKPHPVFSPILPSSGST
jgi:hypothetical protein